MSLLKRTFKLVKNKTLLSVITTKIVIKKSYKYKSQNKEKEYLIKLGKINLGYVMNLDNPKTYNEKLNWYKLNYKNDLMIQCVDKVLVDEYVKSKGLGHILTKKYAIWNNPEEIDITNLPNKFVIKTNHDTGGVVVCRRKEDFNKDKYDFIKKHFEKDFCDYYLEWPYKFVEKKIFAEEIIETNNGKFPLDYKFFCFNGEPKFIFVGSERETEFKIDFFDTEWNWLNVKRNYPNAKKHPEKPGNLAEMLEIAKVLSKDFPHVRVDLYNENGKIRFGELTFYSGAGIGRLYPHSFDYKFGEYFDIECIKNN